MAVRSYYFRYLHLVQLNKLTGHNKYGVKPLTSGSSRSLRSLGRAKARPLTNR